MARALPIISILFLVAIVLAGIFLWWPNFQEFEGTRAELEVKKIELKQKQDYFTKLEELDKKLEDYEEELKIIGFAFPTDLEIAPIFNFIQKTGSESGLIIKQLGTGKESRARAKEEIEMKKFTFSVGVSGSYSSLKNFLSTIYKNSRLFDVNFISFTRGEVEGSMFDVDLTMKTHYYPGAPKAESGFMPEGGLPQGIE